MNDLVSIIIPVYNVEKYLSQCVESVINQTYQNLEIILVDDGSPDNCGRICDVYSEKDSRIRVIHKENGGVASARQVGMDICTGEWIYFLDSDDWIELNLIATVLDKAKSTDSDAVVFDFDYFDGKKMKRSSYMYSFTNKEELVEKSDLERALSLYMVTGLIWHVFFRASTVKEITFKTNVSYCDDLVFKFDSFRNICKFYCLPEVLHHYRYNCTSYTHTYDKFFIEKVVNFHSELVNLIAMGDDFSTYQKSVNSRVLGAFSSSIMSLFSRQNPKSFKEKIGQCNYLINYLDENDVFTKYNEDEVGGSAKLLLKLKKLNWFKVYLIYLLKKCVRVVRRR